MPKSYPPEFRRRAIALVEAGRTVREVAFDLEIGEQTIYNWLRQHRIDTGQAPGVSSSESLELHNARRRIREGPVALAQQGPLEHVGHVELGARRSRVDVARVRCGVRTGAVLGARRRSGQRGTWFGRQPSRCNVRRDQCH